MFSRNLLVLAAIALVTASCDILSALGVTDCTGATAYTFGTTVAGKVGDGDCKGPDGDVGDPYEFTLTSQTTFVFEVSGGQEVSLFYGSLTATTKPAEVGGESGTVYTLPPGQYLAVVAGAKGDYTFRTSTTVPTNCVETYVLPGVTISGAVTTADCAGNAPARMDMFSFRMRVGQSVSVTGSTNNARTAIALYTGISNPTELVVRKFDTAVGGSGQFSYTATAEGEHRVHVFCEPSTTGSCGYTVTIQ